MGWFEWLAQLAVVALLAGTIPVALRLERALRAVRRDRTELILITARVMVTSNGLAVPRRTVSTISVLTGPRIFSTAWLRVNPMTGSPSRWLIRSPGSMPARWAGVSSMGEITLIRPLSMDTWMPNPPNSPRVWTCISRKFLALR